MGVTKVWAVTSGSYSSYSVDLLFTTKELAEAHIANDPNKGQYGEYNDDPQVLTLWDAVPEPDELRWYAAVRLHNHQVVDKEAWVNAREVHPWSADFEDGEKIQANEGWVAITVVRRTKEEAVRRVSELVSEHMRVNEGEHGTSTDAT